VETLVARRIIADKYRLDRPLAAGGMGSVWAAWNTHLDVPVAIKFMAAPLAASQDLVARFEREARAAAQLRSPHVVQIFEHGIDGDAPFIVMELLEGEDLGTRIRRQGRLPVEDAARVVSGVCKALRRAHAMGIVHRDLKPANVFLARRDDDDDETVKVLDFGVVKSLGERVDSGVTKTGELIGTPSYMSPEQARTTKKVDHRSDLWSLGIIAYRALTGSLPFPAASGLERLMLICNEPIPPPSTICPDLGPDVDAFFTRALAIDPDARFQTAREMAEAMKALAGIPSSTGTDSRGVISDGGPPSSSVYTGHAYVYTSAADAERGDSAPGSRSPAASGRSRPSAAPASAHDGATRVSNVDRPGPPRSGSPRPSVSIVTGALADASGPLPPLSSGDLDTLSSAGLARSSGTTGRLARPRVALGAGIAVLLALVGALSALVTGGAPDGGKRQAANAATAMILFATAAPAHATATFSGAPAATAAAPAETAPRDAASPEPVASGAPAPKQAATPPVPPKGVKPARPGGTPGGRGAASVRKEGGIGRRPTY
jgi:eukaryotic-like serine/threonine-protein kinase